jgi:hypothetical protein
MAGLADGVLLVTARSPSAALRRHHRSRRVIRAVLPSEVRRLETGDPKSISASLLFLVPEVNALALDLGDALGLPADGGAGGVVTLEVSPQRKALLQSVLRLEFIERALFALFARNADPDVASRIATVVREKRGALVVLGLDRVPVGVPRLDEYLCQHRNVPTTATPAADGGDADG